MTIAIERTRPGPVSQLGPGQVHVWQASVHSNASRCESHGYLLDPAERRRAASFRHESDRQRYVVAHVTLRRMLGAYLGREPGLVRLEKSWNGKPVLGGVSRVSGLRFSLSHDQDLVLIAVARLARVGVDVQSHPVPARVDTIADAVLTGRERDELGEAGPDGPGLARFWVRKEAVLKATGTGLGGGVERIDAAGDSPVSLRAPGRRFPLRLRVHDLDVGPGYAAALATPPWCRSVLHLAWDRS